MSINKLYITGILILVFGIIALFFKKATNVQKPEAIDNIGLVSELKLSTVDTRVIDVVGFQERLKKPLYGFNGNNVRGPSWSTPELMTGIKSLPFNVIRYPGGNVANWWDWRSGWFIEDANLPGQYQKIPKAPITLRDLKQFVDQTNSEVVFVLNLVSDNLKSQQQMLQEAARLGIAVNYVELGNEFNLFVDKRYQKINKGLAYGQVANKWSAAIKKLFPDVKIGIVAGDIPKRLPDWNTEVLTSVDHTDALVWHVYPSMKAVVTEDNGVDFKQLNTEIFRLFEKSGLAQLEAGHKLWITEYNLKWHENASNKKQLQYHVTTWGQALSTVSMTSIFTGLSTNVDMILNHNLTGFPIFAAVQSFPKPSFQLTPNGMGMKLWLDTASGMTELKKLSLFRGGLSVADYEVFGWEFCNDAGERKVFLVNLTGKPVEINLNQLYSIPFLYESFYAEKNAKVIDLTGLKQLRGKTKNGLLKLPQYSINILNR